MKLISDSPWARPLSVLGSILGTGQAVGSRSSQLPNVATAGAGRSSTAAMSAGTAMGQTGGFAPNDPVPVSVRWLSSVRIRQALGRLGQIQSNAPESEAGKFAEQPMEDYQIAVIAPVMNTFDALSLEDFKQRTFLTSRKDKAKRISLKGYIAPKGRSDGPTFELEASDICSWANYAQFFGLESPLDCRYGIGRAPFTCTECA
jgi:hypothetical protein